MRGGALIIVGSVVAVVLVGCKPSWFESREPWRAEAEAQCLKSGVVKEGGGVIEGGESNAAYAVRIFR